MKKRIKAAVFTSGRQDYGILRSTLQLIENDPDFDLQLLVGGMHLSDHYGNFLSQIILDGFVPVGKLDWLGKKLPEPSISNQVSTVIRLVSESLTRLSPDYIILVGDRYETIAAALAAVLNRIPIVHLHGGEETEGAIDNQFRHAITKMSCLHFVSHSLHAARIIQMGETPESVFVVGAPGLDNLFRDDLPDKAALEARLGLKLDIPIVIVTLHPVTGNPTETNHILSSLIDVMKTVKATYVITLPNSDLGNQGIRTKFCALAEKNDGIVTIEALGEKFYFGLMRIADTMIGNSSSGLIEAGAYKLPTVDIGTRQQGRLFGPNVLHADPDTTSIQALLEKALSDNFRQSLIGTTSIYGDGKSAQRILMILKNLQLPISSSKVFYKAEMPG